MAALGHWLGLGGGRGGCLFDGRVSCQISHISVKFVFFHFANKRLGVGASADSPAGAAVGSAVDGAAAVSVFVGSGMAGVFGASVLVPVVPFVAGLSDALSLIFLKMDLSLSMLAGGEAGGVMLGQLADGEGQAEDLR